MLAIALIIALLSTPPAIAGEHGDWYRLLIQISREEGVNPKIMLAIAIKESRRDINGYAVPWPYAVRTAGGSWYPRNEDDARRIIMSELTRGVRPYEIDAGAYQINLRWARQHLPRLLDAVNPETNIRIAARMLKRAMRTTGSLALRIGRYHSYRQREAMAYGQQVLAIAESLPPIEKEDKK